MCLYCYPESSLQPLEVGTMIDPILQMSTLRHREDKSWSKVL